ncbi:hypothetical protein GCM10028778_19560 [Barrientosiimonas marina]|uniref:Transporter n=1 Tax=Lentibacillus kimchii TaxID=1542911 RepID=A0ABW2UQG0_9BACI
MQKVASIFYESVMIILVMLTIITIWTDSTYNSTLSWIVWGIFFIDFMARLIKSPSKWVFIKENPFLVIAIIPFDQFFQIARIVRLVHLFRLKTITKYYLSPLLERMTLPSKSLILMGILVLLLSEAGLILFLENGVQHYGEALFAVFSYLFFFGHRIFDFDQTLSIWTLTAVTVLGIALQGLALQWLFNRGARYMNNS